MSGIHDLARANDVNGMRQLLASNPGALNEQDWYGQSPLHEAALYNRKEVAKVLLAAGAKVDLQNKYGKSPLFEAALNNKKGLAEVLLAAGAMVDLQDKYGESPLHEAACWNKKDLAEVLLAAGAYVDLQSHYGRSPLFVAALYNSKEVAKTLLAAGAKFDLQNKDGNSPLYWAASNNSKEVAEILLAAGAKVNLQNKDGESPLFEAALYNSKEVAEVLLAAGAKVDIQTKDGRSPLHVAAYRNKIDVVEVLLAAGAKVNLQNEYGESLLYQAASNNSKEVVEILLAAGANFDLQDKYGHSPLFGAVSNNKIEVVEVLLAAGAKVNLQNEFGHSPLYVAVSNNSKEVAEVLLAAGAEVDLQTKDGKTPLILAKEKGHSEIVTFLEKYHKNTLRQEAPEEVIWGRSRIMIVGEGRAGKTSFYTSMQGFPPGEITQSTCGLKKYDVRFSDITGKEEGIALRALADTEKEDIRDVAANKQLKLMAIDRIKESKQNEESSLKPMSQSSVKDDYNLGNNVSEQKEKKDDYNLVNNVSEQKEKKDDYNLVNNVSEQKEKKYDYNLSNNVSEQKVKKDDYNLSNNESELKENIDDYNLSNNVSEQKENMDDYNLGNNVSEQKEKKDDYNLSNNVSEQKENMDDYNLGNNVSEQKEKKDDYNLSNNVLEIMEIEDDYSLVNYFLLTNDGNHGSIPTVIPVGEGKSAVNILDHISHKDLDISVIDYGGQNIFHCFHHLFLKPYGVYCILFNMEKFLTDEANTLYHIKYWYNSIILHTSNQVDGKVSNDFRIIIVGTHRDKLKQKSDMIEISKEIENAIKDSPGFANIVIFPINKISFIFDEMESKNWERDDFYFFPVDNARFCDTDKVFQILMIEMFQVISESNYVQKKINLEYFNVLENIQKHYLEVNVQKKDKLLAFITDILLTSDSENQLNSEEILEFFIDKNLFLEFGEYIIFHFDTFLINSITKIIYDPRYHSREIISKYQSEKLEFQILIQRGIVSDTYIRKLLNKNVANEEGTEADKNKNTAADLIDETDLVIKFMLNKNLMICIDKKSSLDSSCLYLIPSLVPESKLSYNRLLSPSALFFFKIRNNNNHHFDPKNCFMSDNLFYHLMCKLIELSKNVAQADSNNTYVSKDQDDNFIFKDLIMIKLGAHIIILKSFPEAHCIQLHALNPTILRNYIILLTYIIMNEITPRVDFDIIVYSKSNQITQFNQKLFYSSMKLEEIWNQSNIDQDLSSNNKILIYFPKLSNQSAHISNKGYPNIFLAIIILLTKYDYYLDVKFYENSNEIKSKGTDIKKKGDSVLFVRNEVENRLVLVKDRSKFIILFEDDVNEHFDCAQLDYFVRSWGIGSNILINNSDEHWDKIRSGNKDQGFHNKLFRFSSNWESSNYNYERMRYFKMSVLTSEIKLFFRSLLYLNGSDNVSRQLPELLSNSGSPAKFLGSMLKEMLESLNPIIEQNNDIIITYNDVRKSYKILVCLVRISSAITTVIANHQTECEELQQQHRKVEGMIKRFLSSENMSRETNVLSALLGINVCPLISCYKYSNEGLRKLRAAVFTDSILANYITEKEYESNMYTLVGSWQVSSVIDNTFWNSSRLCTSKGEEIGGGTSSSSFSKEKGEIVDKRILSKLRSQLRSRSSNCSHLNSNPSLLLFLEFIFSLVNLFLVVYTSFQDDGTSTKGYLWLLISVMVLGVGLRELGELHSCFLKMKQSKSHSKIMVSIYRTAAVYCKDFWNFFDMMGLLSLLCWLILQYLYQPPFPSSVEVMLSLTLKLSMIPLTIGLLRYFLVLKAIGQFIILIFSMTFDLWRFGFIYLVLLLGFGFSLKALFYEYEEFHNTYNLFLSMFRMSLNTFPYDTFHGDDEYQYVGEAINILMVLSVSIILVNAIIAKFGITFKDINNNVSGIWAINKARYISRYLHNNSPALMLPPPLNIVILGIYLILRICAWNFNVTFFMIPDKDMQLWWYAHADLINNDVIIGVCSSISSVVVSLLVLPFCVMIESTDFIVAVFPLCIHWGYLLIFIFFLMMALPIVVLYYFLHLFYDIFLTFADNMTFLYYKANLMNYFLTKEGRDIWDIQGPKWFSNRKKLPIYCSKNHRMSPIAPGENPKFLFLWRKWPISCKNCNKEHLEKSGEEYFRCNWCRIYLCCDCAQVNQQQLASSNKADNKATKDIYYSRIIIISRMEWYYNNFSPERSLRYIYEEVEYGLGKEFLMAMIQYMRKGVDSIEKEEGKGFYDSVIPPVIPNVNVTDMLVTPEDCQRIFNIEDEEEPIFSSLKRHLQKLNDESLEKIKKIINEGLEEMKKKENNLLVKFKECIMEKKLEEQTFSFKNRQLKKTNIKKDLKKEESVLLLGKKKQSSENNENNDNNGMNNTDSDTMLPNFSSTEPQKIENLSDCTTVEKTTECTNDDENNECDRVELYMKYFHEANTNNKLVEDGKYASRFDVMND